MFPRWILMLCLGVAAAGLAAPSAGAPTDWPKDIPAGTGTITIYQPQVEDLKNDALTVRAAFSFLAKGKTEPVFGVFWAASKIQTDRDANTATLVGSKVTKVRFPGVTPELEAKFAAIVEGEIPKWNLTLSLDQLMTSVAAAQKERASVENLKTNPPKVVFSNEPAVLVFIDGEPRLLAIEKSNLQRVINTPFAIVFDPASKDYYLSGNNAWYSAKEVKGPWNAISKPPTAVASIVPADTSADAKTPSPPPKVIVALEPTELLCTNGAPQYAAVVGADLLYVTNTENEILKEVATQKYWILLSGRWYSGATLEGPWTFVRSDALPASFKKIPVDSVKGHLLASVAGTPQAEDAVADAQIPQTSAVKRSEAKFEAKYDGEPKFEKIPGTEVEYAVNTGAQVLKIKSKYYAVDQGVWFVASSPKGPWAVSDTRPAEVDSIPASSPVYNVKYVYVYETTPTVVYVGYTPGYVGCYPYYGTVVWGTGWYYPPYVSPYYYYPRPVTYGFHATYNPWTGSWGFGFTASNGFMTVGVHWHTGYSGYYRPVGWYGAGGYYRPPYHGGGYYRPPGAGYPGYRPPAGRPTPYGTAGRPQNNIYNRPGNSSRVDTSARPAHTNQPKPSTGKANNVYSDRDGNVYKRDDSGWQKREGSSWSPSQKPSQTPSRTPSTPDYRGSSSSQTLERDHQARQRSTQRSSYSGRSGGGGASRGGGGGGGRRR